MLQAASQRPGFDEAPLKPLRALSKNAWNQHEYWLESRCEGRKSANLSDLFLKNEARNLLKMKTKYKKCPKTNRRNEETGKLS
jgi:hypothetical protein